MQPALAQVSGNVAVMSDYRYRGLSLTNGKPAAQLSATYDDPLGWYAGGSLTAVLAHCWQDCGALQGVVYGGYAARQTSDLAWDVGGDFRFSAARQDYRFGEAYAGVSYRDVNARVYYAPEYYEQSIRAVYAEVNGALPVGTRARLLAHVGWLRTGSNATYGIPSATRVDVLLGGSIDVESFELQLTWQHAAARGTAYPAYPDERRNAWVFTVSRAF